MKGPSRLTLLGTWSLLRPTLTQGSRSAISSAFPHTVRSYCIIINLLFSLPYNLSHYLVLLYPELSLWVEPSIVNRIVVPLCQDADLFARSVFLHGYDSVDNRDSLVLKLINDNIPWYYSLSSHQEQYVPSVISWLHTSTILKFDVFPLFGYLSTTTTGDSVLVTTMRVFQIIRAEQTIMPKLRPCRRS